MMMYQRKHDGAGAQKAIDEYILNPKENMNKILYFLRNRSIDFKSIPKAKQTKELLMAYLDMPEITYVRVKWISKKLLDDEVWRKLALKCCDYEDIPSHYLTESHYRAIVQSDYYAKYMLNLIPADKMTEALLVEALATTFEGLHYSKLDASITKRYDIDSLKKRALELRTKRAQEQKKTDELTAKKNGWIVYRKGYDTETKKFFFNGKQTKHSEEENLEFDSFDEFYKFMFKALPERRKQSDSPRPLEWVDLSAYDFKNTDLSQYDLTGCLIQTKFLDKAHCFVDYSPKLLTSVASPVYTGEEDQNALVSYEKKNIVKLGDTRAKHFRREDYNYVSDIHLTHRILNQLGSRFTKEQVAFLIKNIVKSVSTCGITLIGGDTSESFGINRLFYSLLMEESYGTRIIILGNHELWDEALYKKSPIDDIIDAYRQLFKDKKCHYLLQNDLYIEKESFRYILSENEILERNAKEITDLCDGADIIILGGIGFTGYCKDKDPKTGRVYSAEFGLYRKALMTIDEDLQQTQRFENVYDKLKDILSERKVIVFTHTPKECWSKEPYVKNWIYVNGHTHHNIEIVNDEKTIFADNQIGYHNENVRLKTFCIMRSLDLFYEHLEDGIHEITVQQYREFYRSKGTYVHVNADIGKILMLKKKKRYMFLVKKYARSGDGGKLYILDGGVIHTADFDEQYYYDNMDVYVKAVNSVFEKYWEAQKSIAHAIKKIGGEGTAHGCIIDIDYYDHVYFNPFDGSLTFYYATSMTDKYVYENLGALLEDRKNDDFLGDNSHYIEMAENYRKLVSKKEDSNLQIISGKPVFVGNTDMYKASRIMKRLQYIADNNILRVWNDGVLNYYKTKGKKQLVDFSVAFSSTEINDTYEID